MRVNSHSYRPFIYLSLGVAGVLAAYGVVVWFSISGPAERGQFGDMFGMVNALFSGLAFAGIVYTVHAQRTEAAFNAHATERAARLNAMSVLVAAYTERVRYLDSLASPDGHKIEGIQGKLKQLVIQLEREVHHAEPEA